MFASSPDILVPEMLPPGVQPLPPGGRVVRGMILSQQEAAERGVDTTDTLGDVARRYIDHLGFTLLHESIIEVNIQAPEAILLPLTDRFLMLGMGADYQIAGTEGDLIIYPISTYMPLDPSYIAVFTTEVPVGELRDPQVQLDLLTTIWSVRFSPPLDTVYRSEGYLPFAYSSSYTLNDVTYYPILTFW